MFVQSISKTKTRIAYHNPWTNSSENQAFASMAEAAARIGVELAACASHEDIEACNPDFVISLATAVPKVVDLPTYLVVHEPKSYLFEQPQRLRNILSYDGYLTISDRLERFIRDFSHGVGRPSEPGFFFNTPQTNDLRSDWRRPDRASTLRVAYFGTNWNRRMPLLFRTLDRLELLRIHGPEGSWRKEGLKSYAGPVPFDGAGPQRIYAECRPRPRAHGRALAAGGHRLESHIRNFERRRRLDLPGHAVGPQVVRRQRALFRSRAAGRIGRPARPRAF